MFKMIDGIEQIYQQIADSIAESIPDEWETAKIEARFFADSSQYQGEYTRVADGVARSFPITMSAGRAFREMRKKFRESGKPIWGQATFELQSDGKFDLSWGYDNCDENGDTIFDEEAELARNEARHRRLSS